MPWRAGMVANREDILLGVGLEILKLELRRSLCREIEMLCDHKEEGLVIKWT
jgi:hypothetical protein